MIVSMIDQFPPDIYKTIVALPYRVGLYISMSDRTGGSVSEDRELAALENIVTFFVEDALKSEFAQTVMLSTLQHKAHWADWRENIDDVLNETVEILGYLEDRIDGRNLTAFRNNLLEIAITVANAYRETQATRSFTARLKDLLTKRHTRSDVNHAHMNISQAEKDALNLLADSLGIAYKVH